MQIENTSYECILDAYDSEETFFYLDPPYIPSTRRENMYRYEFDEALHEVSIDRIQKLKGKVMLSGYRSKLHEQLENQGWIRKDFDRRCYAVYRARTGDTKPKRLDSVWINYDTSNGELRLL